MKMISRFCRRAVLAAVVAATAAGFTSCADHDIKGGNNNGNGNINGPLDPVEAYTRAFVKEFGEFKAQKWSDGVDGVISIRTSKPTQINVFADVDGQRFLFASLGSVYGTQPVVCHIPDCVEEFIVSADGKEYKAPLGKLLDLSDGSRYGFTPTYATELPHFGNLTVTPRPDMYREIELTGSKFKKYVMEKNSFQLFDSDFNFKTPLKNPLINKIFVNGRFAPASSKSDVAYTVYPLYWRENIYGESDYMLGIYYYEEATHMDYDPENNHSELIYDYHKIKMIDLEDFDIKQAITFKKNGGNEFVVSGTATSSLDTKKLNNFDNLRIMGRHILVENMQGNPNPQFGFYIKSGLKDGYTEGKGRNYTHITFQSAMFNAYEWGDNYWDVPYEDINYSYVGAAFGTTTMIEYTRDRPVRADGLTAAETGVNQDLLFPIGFMSQPNGPASNADPDFCDVVIALAESGDDANGSVGQKGKGETFGTFPWILAAEDLGSTDDWDFNDLVVNIYDLTTDLSRPFTATAGRYPTPNILARRITVVPKAAGGTMPLYLMYEGEVSEAPTDETLLSAINSNFKKGTYVVGTELHAWLGEPDYTKMLNTGLNDGYDGCGVSFCVPVIQTSGSLDFDIQFPPQTIPGDNQPIRGFWVLVDKEDNMRAELENTAFDVRPMEPEYGDAGKITRHLSQTKNVLKEFSGKLGEGAYRVRQPGKNGDYAPQMLMTAYNWRWLKERANIGKTYYNFPDWVAGRLNTWYNVTSEGQSNGYYNPTMVCDNTPVAWMQ
ncbi:MAG: hypothetical protein K2L21_08520 [Muribaculaceae bacterium]|nr:hypothetical protein [Muribaculaceae bacterium]